MRSILVSAIALALAGVSMTVMAETPAAAPAADLATTQLPRTVRPSHYDVAVTPHADKLAFDGTVTIDVDVLQPTSSITLNAVDMDFTRVSLTPATAPDRHRGAEGDGRRGGADRHLHLRPADRARQLQAGDGLHRQDRHPGHRPVRARLRHRRRASSARCSPSSRTPTRAASSRRWDEPAYKATFDARGDRARAAQMAVSNMPVGARRTDLGNGLVARAFRSRRRRCRPTCCSSAWATSSAPPP